MSITDVRLVYKGEDYLFAVPLGGLLHSCVIAGVMLAERCSEPVDVMQVALAEVRKREP